MVKKTLQRLIGCTEAAFMILFIKMVADWEAFDIEPVKTFMTGLARICISLILLNQVIESIAYMEDIGIKMPWNRKRGE